tara:strand:+ start:5188 stop:6651 length:1464 start_codon:yes stop_codon:yes gene_type:complete
MRKKLLLVLFVLLISLSIVEAITIHDVPTKANLGDLVAVQVDVVQQETFQGLLSITLKCPNLELPYYTNFLQLEANVSKTITSPGLSFISLMEGQCSYVTQLKRLDNTVVEEATSNTIEITSTLPFTASFEDRQYDPGENIKITGEFSVTYDNFDYASLEIELGGTYVKNITKTSFSKTLKIPGNAPSGSQSATVSVSDAFGNKGVVTLPIVVTQIPTAVLIDLSKHIYDPNNTMQAIVKYVDQANKSIPEAIEVKLEGPKQLLLRDVIDEKTVTDTLYTYTFDQYAEPGDYRISASSGKLDADYIFNVSAIKDLRITFDDSRVIIDNIGNIKYLDDITIQIPNSDKIITSSISLTPGTQTVIDLSKYAVEISVPVLDSTLSESSVSDTVTIEKKGLVGTTGAAITGVAKSSSFWVVLVIIGAIAGVVVYFKKKGFGEEKSEDIDLSKVQQAINEEETLVDKVPLARPAKPSVPADEDIVVELDDED